MKWSCVHLTSYHLICHDFNFGMIRLFAHRQHGKIMDVDKFGFCSKIASNVPIIEFSSNRSTICY
jgi:hypothetical protein